MSTEDSTIVIAPHLWRALGVMARDMAVDPAALVNQAAFAWLRINGYLVPGTVCEAAEPEFGARAAAFIDEPDAAHFDSEPELAPEADVKSEPHADFEPEPQAELEPEARADFEPESQAEAEQALPSASTRPAVALAVEAPGPSLAGAVSDASAVAHVARRLEEIEANLEQVSASKRAPTGRREQLTAADRVSTLSAPEHLPPEPEPELEPELEPDDQLDAGLGENGTHVASSAPILVLEREGAEALVVDRDSFTIGRGPTCDLIIDSPRVSREHARITREMDRFLLADLGSSNGTWLGEERIVRKQIEDGEEYLLGSEYVRFSIRTEG